MPKTAVHVIVLDQVIDRFRKSSGEIEKKIGEIMYAYRRAAVLGAIGPDLFFWAPDFEVVRKLHNFYKNWKWVIDLYNETIGKVKKTIEALGEPVEQAVETLAPSTIALIKTLIHEIDETVRLLKSSIATMLFSGVIEGYDVLSNLSGSPSLLHTLFDEFTPPLQKGKKESDWYWFDMLHYRWTGKFAANLVNSAKYDVQIAYAFGYLTHIATDVIGHGYVNQIVGGPYRMHMQRHATVENYIDSWKFYKVYGESINSKLNSILELPSSLPSEIVNLLHDSFKQTYQYTPHPSRINRAYGGFFKPEDIYATYEVYKFVTEVLGSMNIKPPEEPFSGVLDILSDALRGIKPPPSPPRPRRMCSFEDIMALGLTEESRECYEEFVKSIEEWLEYLGDLLKWTFETILAIIDFISSLLLTIPIMILIAILYGIQLALYTLLRQFRQTLVLAGLLYPEPDELNSAHGRNLITNYQCNAIVDFKGYPRTHSCELNNLQCPRTSIEEPGTLPALNARSADTNPDNFIFLEPFNQQTLSYLREYAKAPTPDRTRELEASGYTLGNAVSLSYWMILNALLKKDLDIVFTDWNLDSDRGYGYKCWYWDPQTRKDSYVQYIYV